MTSKAMRNSEAKHIDYGFMKGVISENFMPSNIDGILERNGQFIVMEWKREGEKFSKGQEILLRALSKTPCFTLLIITGDTDNGINFKSCWVYNKKGEAEIKYTEYDDFIKYLKFWYEVA